MPFFGNHKGHHRNFFQQPTKLKSIVENTSKSSFNYFQSDSPLTPTKSQTHSTLSNEHIPKDCKVKNQGI